MIAQLMCAWCICGVFNAQITECSSCNNGTQKDALERIAKFSTAAGQISIMECIRPGENYKIDWAGKGLRKK